MASHFHILRYVASFNDQAMYLAWSPAPNPRVPCDFKGYTHTLMDMRTELKAVPHAGLGFHFLRVPVGSHRILEVLKGKEAQSTRSRSAIRSK